MSKNPDPLSVGATPSNFSARLVAWQREHGRHGLPWQVKDPYKVWVSELMLQQTQVSTVLRYYSAFLLKFPTVVDLAAASLDDVYAMWSGLGFYRRARFLHEGAKMIVDSFDGVFPVHVSSLMTLPGVGQSTAHAIASFCYNSQVGISDGNVQRSLARLTGQTGDLSSAKVQQTLQATVNALALEAAPSDMPAFTQGLMDFGSSICTPNSPSCGNCPFAIECVAFSTHRVEHIPNNTKKKTQQSKKPTKIVEFKWFERVNPFTQEREFGFSKYAKHLGVWENLYGPPAHFSHATPATFRQTFTHEY